MAADGGEDEAPKRVEDQAGMPRSPLIIGAVAYGLLGWMMLVVLLLIAWKLFAH